ncbi:MAG: hypothetical protein HYS86_04830 [Candidatus Chisholmbacteria bacterium]|nr:hypothetical protein [Candidatus Chisholmbacteria bacterium]
MVNPSPPLSTAPSPSPSKPALVERFKAKLDSLPKTHRLAIITATLLILLLGSSAILLSLGTNKQSFENEPLNLPTPSPPTLTRFAQDPTVATAEATLRQVTGILENQKITDTPLLPPPLDMEVSLNP